MSSPRKRIHCRPLPETLPSLNTDLHPVLARIYAARKISDRRQLEKGLQQLHPTDNIKGMADAVALLAQAVEAGRRMLIVGDFDADGATSSAVAVNALRAMGAGHVDFLVPNRFEYGYGLTPEIVAVAAQKAPDVIVTVDNGIASIAGVAAAKALGLTVIVTDHHLPGQQLPAADAIVNPNQPGCDFPSKHLAGVGVIFYVMLALRAALRDSGWFDRRSQEPPNLAQLLDLVALGTVADVVPLDHTNRILVAQGLARIRRGVCNEGIRALFEVAGRNREQAVASDLGFVVGPRLNAAGRLEDMSIGIRCLLSDQRAEAMGLAQQLDRLNRERRTIEDGMREQAMAHLEQLQMDDGAGLPTGLCLFDQDWHQGVIGILASRIKERFHRPVIAFAQVSDDEVKGSARSVSGFHIRDGLDAVATRNPGLITKFGGHAMAAGLSLKLDRLEEFQAAFDEEACRHLSDEDLQEVIYSDGQLASHELSMELAEQLRHGGPWGQGFPEPLFDGEFVVVQRRIVGERHLKLLLQTPDRTRHVDAIAFNTVDSDWPTQVEQVRVAYQLDVNEFRGERNVQLLVQYIEPCV